METAVRAVPTAAHRRLRIGPPALVAGLTLAFVLASPAAAGGGGTYKVHKLVSDQSGHAAATDPNLVNGWGITAGPSSPWWVANRAPIRRRCTGVTADRGRAS